MIFTPEDKELLQFIVKFGFLASNNEVEYTALAQGMQMLA